MERLRFLVLIAFFVVTDGAGNTTSPSPHPSPSYVVSVSSGIQSGVPTSVSITILTNSSVLVKSEIIHENKSLCQAESIIAGGTTKLEVLPAISVSQISVENTSYMSPYKLNVKGYNGSTLIFSTFATLSVRRMRVSILIQTDKPKYTPGQDVKIRVLVLTPNGKPYNQQINILIKDPREKLIQQWLAVEPVHGETAKEFQLSQKSPLGPWQIIATVDGVTREKTFNVSHYVLPKFEVLLDAPRAVYYNRNLNFKVTAQYLFGKPVTGNLSVVYVHGTPYHGTVASYEDRKMIDGTAELSFNVSSLYQNYTGYYYYYYYYYYDYYPYIQNYINIRVQVTELLTGVTYNSSVQVSVKKYKYELEFQQYPSNIKPSMNVSAQLRLSTYNNSPLTAEDQSRNVNLTLTQQSFSSWMFVRENIAVDEAWNVTSNITMSTANTSVFYPDNRITVQNFQLRVPADGIIPFRIEVLENVSLLTIEAQYEDVHRSLRLYRGYSSRSYIHLKNSSSPQIGQSLDMAVESNFPLTKFHYMVISQGQVVASGTSTSSKFSSSPDASWIPSAKVLVFCTSPDGSTIFDILDVSFTKILQNNVSLNWGKEHAEPAQNVSLSVSVAEPGSLVGILVVDKASLDTDRSNDFTEKRVIEELTKSLMDGMEFSYGYLSFKLSGVTILTDANVNMEDIYAWPVFPGEGTMMATSLQANQEPPQRQYFPETWLWFDANMSDSTAAFTLTVPDSMTSWVATAFVISENLGLGISAPTELRVSQNLFVSLNLPAYLIRGELLLLEVNLFNYMDQDLEVVLTVEQSNMFEFVTSAGDSNLAGVRQVSVQKQNTTVALFPIRATKLGQMPISVKAVNNYASDALSQKILVKPEGTEQSATQTLFLEFKPTMTSLTRELKFLFPPAAVPGSLRVQVTAVGDILGPSINGLGSLIQMPYGCGEQNMINFAPNVYVLQYLTKSGSTDAELRSKALSYMTQGYVRELTYQRQDGSFSAFGQSDSSGSTWLSAFVLKCFLQSQQLIVIDKAVLKRTTEWLRAQQQNDGSFIEPGRVIHTELQGGLDGPVSLTAYVLMALLEDAEYNEDWVSSATNYLTTKLNQSISSNYSLCLVTYALSLAKSPSASVALTELMRRAQIQDGVPTWSTGGGSVSASWQPRSADIEMASYALLSLNIQNDMGKALPLMKWLSQQRNHLGGYGSTQDTVVALQALSSFASLSNTGQINLNITVTAQTATVATFQIDHTNYMLYQSREIEAKQNLQLTVSAVGKGFALFQLTTFYNEVTQALSRRRRADTCEAFYLNVDVMDKDLYNVQFNICFRLCENQELNQTGMAILDVGLFTGFKLAQNGTQINKLVRKVETSAGNIILYLDSVTKAESCVNISSTLENKVVGVHDPVVTLYDYYEPRRRAVKTYTSESRKSMSYCSFCGEDCSKCSRPNNNTVSNNTETSGSVSSLCRQGLLQSLFLLLLITFSFSF